VTWLHEAACRPSTNGINPFVHEPDAVVAEAFFPLAGAAHTTELAKRVCDHCPVRSDCLKDALGNGTDDGIWGGLTADERRELRRAGVAA
jgi:WhiB family redox-sensing transcriptional regulator